MARPKKQIDAGQVFRLAKIHCTNEEIAAVLNCSADTIERRFAGIIKRGMDCGRMSLKRKQFQLAMKGNPTMLIWLGKQHLGQSDKQQHEHTGASGGPIEHDVTHAFDADRFTDLYRRRTRRDSASAGSAEANGN